MKKLFLVGAVMASLLASTAALAEQRIVSFLIVDNDPNHTYVTWGVPPTDNCTIDDSNPLVLNCFTDENGNLDYSITFKVAGAVNGPSLVVTSKNNSTDKNFEIRNNGAGGVIGTLDTTKWTQYWQTVPIRFMRK